jgi:hypothetical protein
MALQSNGTPFPDGTDVQLYAIPPSAQLDGVAEGGSVSPTLLTTSSTSGGTGHYALNLFNTSDLTPYKNAAGVVDLQVLAQDTSGQIAQFDFTRYIQPVYGKQPYVSSQSGSDGTLTDPDTDTDDGSVSPGSNVVAIAPDATATPAVAASTVSTNVVTPATYDCAYKLLKRYNAIPTVVGATYSSTSVGGQAFNYTNGSSSSIGVATSLHSGSGFKLSGSVNVDGSNSSTTKYGQVKGAVSYRYTQNFNYGKYSYSCATFPGGARQFVNYQIRPISYSGPNDRVKTSPPSATHCNSRLASGSSFVQNVTTATTYGAAADLSIATDAGGTGNLELSGKSGYNSSIEAVFYNNSTSAAHSLCGTAGDAGTAGPGRIVIK